jgi:hypothetical protein
MINKATAFEYMKQLLCVLLECRAVMVTTERITIAFRGDKHWAEWHRVQRE